MATLKDQLILHEGLKVKPYTDTVGKTTIGIGRNLTDKGISMNTVVQMFNEDIEESVTNLEKYPWFNDLDWIRKRVLIDMMFNMGPGGFKKFKGMIQAIEVSNYEKAADEMLDSLWAKQVKTRAKRLAQMMRSGFDYDD